MDFRTGVHRFAHGSLLVRRLLAPLHALLLDSDRADDHSGGLVIPGLSVECFASAESWLRPRFAERCRRLWGRAVREPCRSPFTMLQALAHAVRTVAIERVEPMARFRERFQGSLKRIGFAASAARHILIGAVATTAAARAS